MPRCIKCGEKFEKKYPNQMGKYRYCLNNPECTKEFWEKAKQNQWKKKKSELKEKLKTLSDYKKELQTVFNAYIRLRDSHLPCISCGRHHTGQYHAGHYRSVGSNPQLRFNEDNVHKQCAPCNNHKSGNPIEYRINLIKKIGQERVEFLESDHDPKHYTKLELIELKVIYKDKIRKLKKNT